MNPLPISIPEPIAQYSIATWCLSGLFCLLLLVFRVGPQAFPRSNQHRFIASDSSLRYVRIRAKLLFTLCVANVVDAANHAIHFSLAWHYRVYYSLLHRMVIPGTFSALAPLAVLGLCYRCAVIVVSERDQRRRYVWFSQVACFLAWILHAIGVLVMTHSMIVDEVPASIQLLDRWVPLWATTGATALPALAVGGSVWSLRLAYRWNSGGEQREHVGRRGSELTEGHRTTHDECGLPSKELTAFQDSVVPSTPISSDCGASDNSSQPPASLNRSNPNCVPNPNDQSIISMSANDRNASFELPSKTDIHPRVEPSAIQVSYPLTRTFRILTYGVFITWIAASVLLLFPMVGAVRNNALFNLVMTVTIALESSFEQLLKLHNRRKSLQRRRGRRPNEGARRKGSWGGNGEVIGESLLDIGDGGDYHPARHIRGGMAHT